jgi:hypothetical protein
VGEGTAKRKGNKRVMLQTREAIVYLTLCVSAPEGFVVRQMELSGALNDVNDYLQ